MKLEKDRLVEITLVTGAGGTKELKRLLQFRGGSRQINEDGSEAEDIEIM